MAVKVRATKADWLRRKKFRLVMAKLVVAGTKSLDEGISLTGANEDCFVLTVLNKAAEEALALQKTENIPRAIRERIDKLIDECLERLD